MYHIFKRIFKVRAEKATVAIGYHFPKTGGTTLFSHFKEHFGSEKAWNYGPHSNSVRFYEGSPLLEELSISELRKLQFIFGHGVNEDLLPLLPHKNICLFYIYRNPIDHMLSQFEHQLRSKMLFGNGTKFHNFLERREANPVSKELLRRFIHMLPCESSQNPLDIDAISENELFEKTMHVLKNFRFVLSTDVLDQQSRYFNRYMHVPETMSRKRIYKKKSQLKDRFLEEHQSLNRVDFEINKIVVNFTNPEQSMDSSLCDFNPFGFDPDLLDISLNKLRCEREKKGINPISLAYKRLFQFLDSQDQLEACRLQLVSEGGNSNRRNYKIIDHELNLLEHESQPRLRTNFQISQMHYHKARVYASNGQMNAAIDEFNCSLDRNPENASAMLGLARLYVGGEDNSKAIALLQNARVISPQQAGIDFWLGRALIHAGSEEEGIQSLQSAVDKAPENNEFKNFLRKHLIR